VTTLTHRREAGIRDRAARAIMRDTGILLADFVFHNNSQPIGVLRKVWKAACELAGVSGRLFP